jgi:steroid 5-alpha reductase family enzyme
MALPAVQSILECADFNKTVLPYLPQLYELPRKLVQSYSNIEELRTIYLETNPLITALAFAFLLSPLCLLVSEINRNYSQVDRLWSILPTVYLAHYCTYAHLTGLPTARLDNLLACSVVWSLRLTFNYWRKGGYSIGSEDYRWFVTYGPLTKYHTLILFQGCPQREN